MAKAILPALLSSEKILQCHLGLAVAERNVAPDMLAGSVAGGLHGEFDAVLRGGLTQEGVPQRVR